MGTELERVEPVIYGTVVVPEDEYSLSDETIADLERGRSANTEAAYARWWNLAEEWCRQRGRPSLPMTAQTLTEFVGSLAHATSRTGQPYAPASLEQAVAAIRAMHYRAGFLAQPNTRGAIERIRVHRQDQAKAGRRVKTAKPITLDALRLMLARCPDTLHGKRDAAILVLGYGLFGRRSELAAVMIEHLTVTDDWLTVFIPISKTDRDAHGEDTEVPAELAPDIDAAAILRRYLDALAEHGITEGPLLRSVNRWGTPGPRLAAAAINDITKRLALQAGIKDALRMTAHGLRAGGPTDAAERGVPVPYIAEQGRWSKTSTAVLKYIKPVDKRRNNPLLRKGSGR